jgi:hypothetical protein
VGVVVGGAPVSLDGLLPEASHGGATAGDDHSCTSVHICV